MSVPRWSPVLPKYLVFMSCNMTSPGNVNLLPRQPPWVVDFKTPGVTVISSNGEVRFPEAVLAKADMQFDICINSSPDWAQLRMQFKNSQGSLISQVTDQKTVTRCPNSVHFSLVGEQLNCWRIGWQQHVPSGQRLIVGQFVAQGFLVA